MVDIPLESGLKYTTTTTDAAVKVTKALKVTAFGDSELSRHRTELTDLDPDTAYRLTVAGSETSFSVQTAPEEITESMTFAVGGDIGTASAVPRLYERAASWDPLFGSAGGDLAYADGEDVDEWVTFLEEWNDYMRSDSRLIPLVAAIGNHELRGKNFDGEPEDALFFYSMFDNTDRDQSYWAFDIGDEFSLLLLDSSHTRPVEGPQTEWLESTFAERSARSHLLVAYHLPAYPSTKAIDIEPRDAIREHWVPFFEEYDVDVAFEHDDHTYKRTHPLQDGDEDPQEGILYLGDGAWGKGPRAASSLEERPYLAVNESELHVIRTELTPDGSQRFRAVTADGDVIDQFERTDDR